MASKFCILKLYIVYCLFCIRNLFNMDNDKNSVKINIPKLRVFNNYKDNCVKNALISKIFRRTMKKQLPEPSDSALGKYYVHREKPMLVKKLKDDELLLPYKMYVKEQTNAGHKHRLDIKINEKYKTVSTDLKKRLHMETLEDDVRAISDKDKHFFDCVNGRPFPDRIPVYKSFKMTLANILRVKGDISYRYDAILNIEVNHSQELDVYNVSLNNYKEQVRYFDNFILEDYKKSMNFLKQWETIHIKLQTKTSEQEALATKQFTIISRLLGLNYMYNLQQKYGRFLYYLAPPSWRTIHRDFARSIEIEAKGFDLGQQNEEATFNEILENMIAECFEKCVKPVLYFTQPAELIRLFDSIEQQQMHHFDYVNHLAPQKKILKDVIKCLKHTISQESALVESTIRRYESLLEFSNARCAQLERKFYSILNGLFYESVATLDVLKLYSHLEFSFERLSGEKPMHMDMFILAKTIEDFYMDYTKRLDGIRSGTTKKAIAQNIMIERHKFKRAKEAAKVLLSFDLLERQLLKANEPVSDRFQKLLLPQVTSQPRKDSKPSIKTHVLDENEILLTEAELEYLTLFTDWTDGEDTKKYIHKLEKEK